MFTFSPNRKQLDCSLVHRLLLVLVTVICQLNRSQSPTLYFWGCEVISVRYIMIMKIFIPPKSTPYMTQTRWKFLPCRFSDSLYLLQILQIFEWIVLDVMLKRHRRILCIFLYDFCINKQTIRLVISENIYPYLRLREIHVRKDIFEDVLNFRVSEMLHKGSLVFEVCIFCLVFMFVCIYVYV